MNREALSGRRANCLSFLLPLEPVLDDKAGDPEEVPEVVGYAHGAHGDGLRRN